jgi:pimeloyl-ACP methyl ester carboxylesterase
MLPYLERAAQLALNARGLASRRVQTHAGLLHVYDGPGQGRLPTTVVLHGIGSAATQFGRVLLALRPHVQRVLAPDLPGHGFSGVPPVPVSPELFFVALSELLATLTDRPLALVGNSLGGALALRYALDHPSRVRALVLISPAGAQMTPVEWQALLDHFRLETNADARKLLDRLYHRTPLYMPAFASGLRASFQRKAVADILAAVTPTDLPAPERLRALSVPTLVLWGRSERLLPASSLAYFRSHLPQHTQFAEPEGFGHCPHIDDPGRLARMIVDFLATSESHF